MADIDQMRSIQYFFPEGEQQRLAQVAPPTAAPAQMPLIPIHPDILQNNDYQAMEDAVDRFIAANPMQRGARFMTPTLEGPPRYYEYLGKNSGGRKDWRESKPIRYDVPMS